MALLNGTNLEVTIFIDYKTKELTFYIQGNRVQIFTFSIRSWGSLTAHGRVYDWYLSLDGNKATVNIYGLVGKGICLYADTDDVATTHTPWSVN